MPSIAHLRVTLKTPPPSPPACGTTARLASLQKRIGTTLTKGASQNQPATGPDPSAT
jgi:hypothetical protein